MKKVILFTAAAMMMTSCATVFQGSRQEVQIQAEPSTAKIYVDGGMEGKGNVTVNLKRNQNHTIRVEADGYDTEHRKIRKKAQAGFIIADILFIYPSALTSIIVDAATGAWHKFEDDSLIIQLEKKE